MKIYFVIAAALFAVSLPVSADDGEDVRVENEPITEIAQGAIEVAPNRLAVEVNGIVCSFCAYGLEKALGKMPGIDGSQFGNGVLVEIESQRVTLALEPGAAVDFSDAFERIKDAGYDPVRFHFRVAGVAREVDGAWQIEGKGPAQTFTLASGSSLQDGGSVDLLVQLDAALAKDADANSIPEVTVNARF